MKYLFLLTLFLSLACLGCWERVATMAPGDTEALAPIVYEDYTVTGCVIAKGTSVSISGRNQQVFNDIDANLQAARLTYLLKTAHVSGTIADVQNYTLSPDIVDITINDTRSVRCELAADYAPAALRALVGQHVTLAGQIYSLNGYVVSLQDCDFSEKSAVE